MLHFFMMDIGEYRLNLKFHIIINVHIFWEGQKILQNLHLTFVQSYVVPVKSKVEISQNILAFSEYMNFTYLSWCMSSVH